MGDVNDMGDINDTCDVNDISDTNDMNAINDEIVISHFRTCNLKYIPLVTTRKGALRVVPSVDEILYNISRTM